MSIRVDSVHVRLDAWVDGSLTGRQMIEFDYTPRGPDDHLVALLVAAWRADVAARLAQEGPADPTAVI